jgi:hypothetical protein
MPIWNKEEARSGGWAQVREALVSFEGTVTKVEEGQWGGLLVDDEGKPRPPREYWEITNENIHVLETTEPLDMDIEGEDFTFRVNMSEFSGSFWVEKFLDSADKFKILLPDGIVGKRVTWRKETLEAKNPKFNSTNYVIAGIGEATDPEVTPQESTSEEDLLELAAKIAVGKTESQFRMALTLEPKFAGSPLLTLAKAGALTEALIAEGRLVKEGEKYQLP